MLSWMRGGAAGDFDELAVGLFGWQFERNAAYRNFCLSLGVDSKGVDGWRGIPAVPTDAFKFSGYPLRCFPEERVVRSFLTSGTTKEVRGRHDFEDLRWYEASILGAWRELGLPDFGNPWFLAQSPGDAGHSSLSYMFGVLLGASGAVGERWLMGADGGFKGNWDGGGEGAVALFSTAIGLLRYAERFEAVGLPEGSWIFETGGYKGLADGPGPEEFRGRISGHFGVPEVRIWNEYSMTELSSQFYRRPGERDHCGPGWTRIRVVDPETGEEAGEGEAGYLEIVDLANVGSVMAIRTQDLAIARGASSFTLLGRDPGALPRGCSRGADDLISKR